MNKLLDINFDNFTYKEIVKMKQMLLSEISKIDDSMKTDYEKDTYSPFEQMYEITNGAYGYLNNPYRKIRGKIIDYKVYIKSIVECYPEHWILDYANLYTHKQVFRFGNGSMLTATSYTNRTKEYLEALELLKEAEKNRYKILKKYLGINISKTKNKNGEYHIYNDTLNSRNEISFYVVKLSEDGESLQYKKYGFRNWLMWTSSGSASESEFEWVYRLEFPERYI